MAVDIAQLGLEVRSDGVVVATERLKKLGDQAKRTETATERLTRQAEKYGKAMQKVGRSMSMYVTAPIVAFAGAAVKAFADFDDAMTQSLAIMGDVSDDMQNEMIAAARKMGRTTAFSAKQAAESYYFLASAGLDAASAVAALPKVAAFAQAGAFDMARATDILTDAQSALGRTMKDPIANMEEMVAVSDVLVGAATKANASVEQFGRALTNKAGIAIKDLNIELETGVAVLAAWADQGVKAEEAGEKFNIVTRDLQTAVRKNEQAFKDFGIRVFDAQGAFRNMADIIADLESALGPMAVKQRGATLAMLGFQDRSVIALRSLIGLSDKIREYEKALKDAGGITDEVAEKQLKSFAKQLGLMKAEIVDMAIEIGGTIAPSVKGIAEDVRDLVAEFNNLDKETQAFILKIGGWLAVLGPGLLLFGGLARAAKPVIGMFKKLGGAMGGLRGIVAGPAGLGLALVGLIEQWRFMDDKIIEATTEAIDEQTESLHRYRGAIDSLDDGVLRSKMLSINDAIDEALESHRSLVEQRALADIDVMTSGVDTGRAAELQRQLDEQKDILDALIRKRDDLSDKIAANAAATRDETAAIDDNNRARGETPDTPPPPLGLTDDEAEALAALIDELDPLAAEMRDVAKAQELLTKALKVGVKQGGISERAYADLVRSLYMGTDAYQALEEAAEEAADAQAEADLQQEDFESQAAAIEAEIQAILGGAEAWAEYEKAMFIAQEVAALGPDATDDQIAAIQRLAEELYNVRSAYQDAADSAGAMGFAVMRTAQLAGNVMRDAMGAVEQGSDAYKALAVAVEAANATAAIAAVLNQGQGDPYSAFFRMATMAAIVASLGFRVASISGSGGGAVGMTPQEAQGTGTVLGDTEAKSESILNAAEITASATSELVGINRGMLHALMQMQGGIDSASEYLARGADNADINMAGLGRNFIGDIQSLIFDPLNLFGGLFGSAKVKDTGIRIPAGTIEELINSALFESFAKIREKKHALDDSDVRWRYQALDEQVQAQFRLIFEGIRDTVLEAAIAMGMDADEVRDKIASFNISEILVSLKDLDGEEAREELNAVFGQIFDNLALSVIPYIGQFQKLGEGLGETLVRVATSVQVMQEAMNALGFTLDATDPETLAQAAVGLVELTGGVEEFISQFTTFFDRFASDEQKLEFTTSQLSRAFESVGLTIPTARDGMIDLMMSLDATTEAGREQIAMILETADVADQYYSLVEKAEEDRLKQAEEFAAAIQDQLQAQRDAISTFVGTGRYSELVALEDAFDEAMKAAKALNASQQEYAMITRSFDAQLRRMAARLTLNVLSMAESLFGEQAGGLVTDIEDGLYDVREVANQVFEDWQRALERIYEFTQDILLDEALTTLTPAEQLAEAQSQFDTLLAAALGGDVEAAAALPDAAQALLEEARFMYASGVEYTKIFDSVLAALDSVAMPAGIPATIIEENDAANDPDWQQEADYTASALAQELERYIAAADLAEALRNLSQVLGVSVIGLATELGIPLNELVQILGVELETLTASTAESIGAVADMLGADVFELLDALGVSLTDLATAYGINIGELSDTLAAELGAFSAALGADVLLVADALGISIDDLAKTFGVGVASFSAEQFRALVEFSRALGTGVGEVAERLGVELGRIEDSTSILSESLSAAVDELPDAIQADLGPLLDNIWAATSDADANDAIDAVGDYILGLPEEFRDQLSPFLELMGYEELMPELRALSSIDRNTTTMIGLLGDIVTALGGEAAADAVDRGEKDRRRSDKGKVPPRDKTEPIDDRTIVDDPVNDAVIDDPVINDPVTTDPGITDPHEDMIFSPLLGWIKAYADGGSVSETGPAILHAGEFVVTRDANNLNVSTSNENNLSQSELREIRNVLVDIKEQNRRYQEADLDVSRDMESSMKQQAEQARRASYG